MPDFSKASEIASQLLIITIAKAAIPAITRATGPEIPSKAVLTAVKPAVNTGIISIKVPT